jgi:hypothetical protein
MHNCVKPQNIVIYFQNTKEWLSVYECISVSCCGHFPTNFNEGLISYEHTVLMQSMFDTFSDVFYDDRRSFLLQRGYTFALTRRETERESEQMRNKTNYN